MELELQQEKLEGYRLILETTMNQEETLESIVPDTYPDIARIVTAAGRVYLREGEAGEGTMRLTGTVQTTVLYMPEGETMPKALDVAIPFQCLRDHPNIHTDSVVRASAWSVFADARAVNPRKIVVRAELVLSAAVYECETKELVSDVAGGPDGSIEKRLLSYQDNAISSVVEKPFLFSDVLRLPPSRGSIEELLLCRPQLDVIEGKLIGRKLVVKGCVQLHIIYRSGEVLSSHCFEVPYSQVLDMEKEGEDGGSLVEVVLKSVDIRLHEGELEVTVEASAQAELRSQRSVTVLGDAYSVICSMDTERRPCRLCTMAERGSTREGVRHFCQTGVQANQVLYCSVAIKELTQREGEKGPELAAQVVVHMLYLSQDNELCSASDTILINTPNELSPGCQRRVKCRSIGDISAIAVTGGIELRFDVSFDWITSKEEEIPCVFAVRPGEAYGGGGNRPSLIIRRVDAGEALWDIAKACGSTIQDICTANELPSETVTQGTLLLIPSKRI